MESSLGLFLIQWGLNPELFASGSMAAFLMLQHMKNIL